MLVTFGFPLQVQQLHHMWLATLWTQGARSLYSLLLDVATIFFLNPGQLHKIN